MVRSAAQAARGVAAAAVVAVVPWRVVMAAAAPWS
jgi:hypothetical protein